jgi:hypothetical protein
MIGFLTLALNVCSLGAHEGHDDSEYVLNVEKENMKAIAKSLGVKCGHCHLEKKPDGKPDFEAPSHFKHTAIHMKLNFVDGLKMKDGSEITCVTCHNGAHQFLPRDVSKAEPTSLVASGMARKEIIQKMQTFRKALGVKCDFCHVRNEDGRIDPTQPTKHKIMAKYMIEHFTDKLLTKDGKPVTCDTCHPEKAEFLPRHMSEAEEAEAKE